MDLLLAKPYANMILTLRQFGFPDRPWASPPTSDAPPV